MVGARVVRVQRPQQRRIVVRASRFVSSKEATEYSAALPAMVANRSAKFGHSDSVRKDQEEDDEGDRCHTIMTIPDMHTLSLEGRDVCQTRKKKGVEVFWVFRTWDDATRNNVPYLVTLVGRKIEDNPNINPAVRFFVAIKLGPVNRKHNDRIVVFDTAVVYSIKIVRATEDIV